MVVGSPLPAREDCNVDIVQNVEHNILALAVHAPDTIPVDDASEGATQCLVHNAGHNHVAVLEQTIFLFIGGLVHNHIIKNPVCHPMLKSLGTKPAAKRPPT